MQRLDPHQKRDHFLVVHPATWKFAGVALLVSAFAVPVVAGDWPQILGPSRNGVAKGEQLLEKWPAEGPKQHWSKPVGEGYSGLAVRGKQGVLFHRYGRTDRVESLDIATGESKWSVSFPTNYSGGFNPDNGPRCVPLIHEDQVFVVSAAGDVHCLALKDGEKQWSRNAYEEYKAPEGYFGAGSSPIVADGKLLLNVGGRNGAGLVAFQLKDGKTAWRSTDEGASYASPILANLGGKQRVVFVTRYNAITVDPANGKVEFRSPFGARGPTVNAASPVLIGDRLFLSSSYGVGAQLIRLIGEPKKVWAKAEGTMSSQYTTCVYSKGHLFGTHGREDAGGGSLRCLDAKTGNVVWSNDDFGLAHVLLVNDHLLLQTIEGQIVLAAADPKGYRELARTRIAKGTTRTLPSLANGKLFVRVNDRSRSRLFCLQVGK